MNGQFPTPNLVSLLFGLVFSINGILGGKSTVSSLSDEGTKIWWRTYLLCCIKELKRHDTRPVRTASFGKYHEWSLGVLDSVNERHGVFSIQSSLHVGHHHGVCTGKYAMV